MLTPAEWLKKTAEKLCDKVSEALETAPSFPMTIHMHELDADKPRDIEAANIVYQTLVHNGWNVRLSKAEDPKDSIAGNALTFTIDMPVGPLHKHDTAAAAASWDALRERCAWFEQLLSKIKGAPKIGESLEGKQFAVTRPGNEGFYETGGLLTEIKSYKSRVEYYARLLGIPVTLAGDTLGDICTFATAQAERAARAEEKHKSLQSKVQELQESNAKLRADLAAKSQPQEGTTDPELVRKRAWLEQLLAHLSRYSPIKLGSDLRGMRLVIMPLPNEISAADLQQIARGMFPQGGATISRSSSVPTPATKSPEEKISTSAFEEADEWVSNFLRSLLGDPSTTEEMLAEMAAADAADIAREQQQAARERFLARIKAPMVGRKPATGPSANP